MYAYLYADKGGLVKEYVLKESINVFNARCKTDFFKLHKYAIYNNLHWLNLSVLERLKNEDWTYVLDGDDNRNVLLEIIKELGYDGFFNYEYNADLIKRIKSRTDSIIVPTIPNEPAIGVLKDTAVILTNTYFTLEELLKLEKAQDYRNAEKEKLHDNVISMLDLKKKTGFSDEFILSIYKNTETLTLSKQEVEDFISDIIADYNRQSSFMEKIKDEVMKNGEYIFRGNVLTKDDFKE